MNSLFCIRLGHHRPHSVFALALVSTLCLSTLCFAQKGQQVDLTHEHLGNVKLGDNFRKVIRDLGQPDESSKELQDPANQCTKQLHFYNSGLEVETCKKSNQEKVHSVRVVKSNKIQTSRGVGPGSTSKQVRDMYPQHMLKDNKTMILVADYQTDIRLRFLLNNGRVYEISLYRNRTKKRRFPVKKANSRRGLFD